MNLEETGILLSKVQAFDNRNVEAAHIIAWHEVLNQKNLADCLEAVIAHYSRESSWIMPSHIMEHVRGVEDARVYQFTNGYHLNTMDEETATESGDWSEACRALTRAVRTGGLTPQAYEAYQSSDQPLEAFMNRKAIQ